MNENEKKLLEQKVEFVPVDSVYSRGGTVTGLQLPDGSIILNMNANTSGATLGLYRKTLGAKYVVVQGTWTFTPNPETMRFYDGPGEK